nr:chloride channel protein [Myxococcota bacterium]
AQETRSPASAISTALQRDRVYRRATMKLGARTQAVLDRARAIAVRASMRISPSEPQRVLLLTIVLGAVCGLVAVAFHVAIAGAQALLIDRFDPEHFDVWVWAPGILLVPAIGGCLAGAALHWVVPSARGSGVPQVKVAYALDASGMRLRDAVGKFLVCTLQLGSGASLGREGPTVQICAGVAMSFGRWLALSPANLRRLIPVGAAAGIAAAFNAPIAAVTFTIEEVVGSLDQTVLSGVVAAAALAAVVEHSMLGAHPILSTPDHAGLAHASSLPLYALLGITAAFVSVAFSDSLLHVRAQVRKSRVPAWLAPGIGGLATGAFACAGLFLLDQDGIAGGGYETLSRALHGELALHALALLCVLKLFATVASYSSGGAGGIFAPTLFIGAMLGGLIGGLDVAVLGHAPDEEMAAFALVGMGAVFAGVVRAPITSVLIIFEMTGGYELVLPLMIANSVAYVISRRMRPVPIYEALLAQDGIQLPHGQAARGALTSIDVDAAMTTQLVTLPASLPLADAAAVAKQHHHATYPVVDLDGRFVGLLSEARLLRALAENGTERSAGEIARRKEYAVPDEPLLRAVARMTRLGVHQLPVLERQTGKLVGLLAMSDVMRAQVSVAETQGSLATSERMTLEPLAIAGVTSGDSTAAEHLRPTNAPPSDGGVRQPRDPEPSD